VRPFYDLPHSVNCNGLEKGDSGIQECDQWVNKAPQGARSNEHDDRFWAEKRRLVWKIALKKASGDDAQRAQVQHRRQQALNMLRDQLKEQGCAQDKQ
jgi:hypothetical protein